MIELTHNHLSRDRLSVNHNVQQVTGGIAESQFPITEHRENDNPISWQQWLSIDALRTVNAPDIAL